MTGAIFQIPIKSKQKHDEQTQALLEYECLYEKHSKKKKNERKHRVKKRLKRNKQIEPKVVNDYNYRVLDDDLANTDSKDAEQVDTVDAQPSINTKNPAENPKVQSVLRSSRRTMDDDLEMYRLLVECFQLMYRKRTRVDVHSRTFLPIKEAANITDKRPPSEAGDLIMLPDFGGNMSRLKTDPVETLPMDSNNNHITEPSADVSSLNLFPVRSQMERLKTDPQCDRTMQTAFAGYIESDDEEESAENASNREIERESNGMPPHRGHRSEVSEDVSDLSMLPNLKSGNMTRLLTDPVQAMIMNAEQNEESVIVEMENGDITGFVIDNDAMEDMDNMAVEHDNTSDHIEEAETSKGGGIEEREMTSHDNVPQVVSGKTEKSDESEIALPLFDEVNLSKSQMKSNHFERISIAKTELSRKRSVQEQIGQMRYIYQVEPNGERKLIKRKSLSKITGLGHSLQ